MNRFQSSVILGGLANAFVMLMFPPYNRVTLGRIEPSFDAYHFVMNAPVGQSIGGGLLAIQLLGVGFFVAMALIFLRGSVTDPAYPLNKPQSVILSLALAAFVVIMLFPPFETMPASRMGAATFHGFDIAFGGGIQRGIFVPMLFLELLLLGINAAVFWLLFGILDRRGGHTPTMDAVVPPPIRPRPGSPGNPYGRSGEERRTARDPSYQGPERRQRRDRRGPG